MSEIRPEHPSDADAIRALLVSAFPTDDEARLVDLLRDAGHLAVSLVAEDEGVIVGHVAFSPVATSPMSAVPGVGLAPVAVLESHREQGIAFDLVMTGLGLCRGAGFGWVVVLGEPEYYSRFGFRPASGLGLLDAYGGGDAFQALELMPNALPEGAGLVSFAHEFASLED